MASNFLAAYADTDSTTFTAHAFISVYGRSYETKLGMQWKQIYNKKILYPEE